ncbi:MAG: 1-deoxy-D-xylulose-5-phosphate synthase [Pseudomonadota bacterium]
MNKTDKLLNYIDYPDDLKKLSESNLPVLCEELREELIAAIAKTGGHLGASLGVIELTVTLHYIFNTPLDKIIWDVGHQAYPHKMLTGRKNDIETIRSAGGLSGFTKRSESIFDPFGAGHSSTSISAALGMAATRDLIGDDYEVISVIGDGAISAGMAYEALNNVGSENKRLIVVLNDNDMSIAPPVGAMSKYLSRLISSSSYLNFRSAAKSLINHFPKKISNVAKKTERIAKNIAVDNNFFEELGFYYIGPLDGHNFDHLLPVFKNIRDDKNLQKPILIHVVTEKGRGFDSPDNSSEKFHAVKKFDIKTFKQYKSAGNITYTEIFSNILTKQAKIDEKICAITAAMPSGTGLNKFADEYPERYFDVGIAEQHAVTFAAGIATENYKPFVAIYSTFLQRAYDQIIHDVAIQNLPVRFMIDRAGLVGADGPTHAGSFDLAYLSNLPNFVIMAPSDGMELARMIVTANQINDHPSAVRYPRGEAFGAFDINIDVEKITPLPIGNGRIVKQGNSDIAVFSVGTRLEEVLKASEELALSNVHITIADARFAKPLDYNLIDKLLQKHKYLLIIEEGATGGVASHIMDYVHNESRIDISKHVINSLSLPDEFINHDSAYNMYEAAGLNANSIVEHIKSLVNFDNILKTA